MRLTVTRGGEHGTKVTIIDEEQLHHGDRCHFFYKTFLAEDCLTPRNKISAFVYLGNSTWEEIGVAEKNTYLTHQLLFMIDLANPTTHTEYQPSAAAPVMDPEDDGTAPNEPEAVQPDEELDGNITASAPLSDLPGSLGTGLFPHDGDGHTS